MSADGYVWACPKYITNSQFVRSSLLDFLEFLDANRPPRVFLIVAAILSKCVQTLTQNIKMPNIPKVPNFFFNILGKAYWIILIFCLEVDFPSST